MGIHRLNHAVLYVSDVVFVRPLDLEREIARHGAHRRGGIGLSRALGGTAASPSDSPSPLTGASS